MKIKNPSKSPTKSLTIALCIIAVAALCYGAYAFTTDKWPFREAQDVTASDEATRDTNSIDYSGPTEQDTANSQNAKEKLLEEGSTEAPTEPTTPPDTDQKKSATVNISYADVMDGNLEVRAFTSSVIQGSGSCTTTVKKAGASPITETAPAFIDVSSTICKPIYIPRTQLSAGTWTVTVTYSSPTHYGLSGAYNVEVN